MFDIPTMVRLSVGPSRANLTGAAASSGASRAMRKAANVVGAALVVAAFGLVGFDRATRAQDAELWRTARAEPELTLKLSGILGRKKLLRSNRRDCPSVNDVLTSSD